MSASQPKTQAAAGRAVDAKKIDLAKVGPGLALGAVLGALLLWSHWPEVIGLWKDWQNDPNYSVGQLVPLVVLYLLWDDRDRLRKLTLKPCWWGLLLVVAAQAIRFAGYLFFYESAQRYALVLTVAGVVLLVTGWRVWWHLRWVLAFLLLMVPLPGRIHNALSGPLQQWATSATVFVLDVIGVSTAREGNVLTLGDNTTVGIAEACSGLRMLTAFVVVAATFALLIDRPRWQRCTVLLSSVPVALICNVIRLVATVILYAYASDAVAEKFFHDFAGITMMPLAVVILMGELWLLRCLVVPDAPPSSATPRK